jgi:hypothetical protein
VGGFSRGFRRKLTKVWWLGEKIRKSDFRREIIFAR